MVFILFSRVPGFYRVFYMVIYRSVFGGLNKLSDYLPQ